MAYESVKARREREERLASATETLALRVADLETENKRLREAVQHALDFMDMKHAVLKRDVLLGALGANKSP